MILPVLEIVPAVRLPVNVPPGTSEVGPVTVMVALLKLQLKLTKLQVKGLMVRVKMAAFPFIVMLKGLAKLGLRGSSLYRFQTPQSL